MKWLLNNRTVFDDNGWAQLLPKDNFEYAVMGGNHFTMMKGEHVSYTPSVSCHEFSLTISQGCHTWQAYKEGTQAIK
jgi:hypothetical protein